jgi:PAS domain S-box-containing protein
MHHQESSTMSQNNNGSVSLQAHWLKFRWTKYFNRFSNKLRFIILITALIMSIILFIISCFVVKHYLIIEAYDNLQTLGQLKQTQIDNYLQQLKGQLILASRDAVVKEAMIEFADAFSSIESGSYELPEYEDLYSMAKGLENFYSVDVIPKLNSIPGMEVTLPEVLPFSDKTKIIQFLYVANNQLPFGHKYRMLTAGDGSSYSSEHLKYQSCFSQLIANVGVADILLIDVKSGNIVYTYQKNIDLGRNIFADLLKGSNLAIACQKALAGSESDVVALADLELYLPDMFNPSFFMAVPVMDGNDKIGLLVFELGVQHLDNILLGITVSKESKFLNHDGNIYLVGEDFTYRSDDYRLKTSKSQFIEQLVSSDFRKLTVDRIDSLNTTANIVSLDHEIFEKVLTGYDDMAFFSDATGEKVLASIHPLTNNNLKWFLVVQTGRKAVLGFVNHYLVWGILLIILLSLIILYFLNRISNDIGNRIFRIKETIHKILSGGKVEKLSIASSDELGETTKFVNDLVSRIRDASKYAIELADGNLDAEFNPLSEEDQIANSLNKLKESLVHSRDEEDKRKAEDDLRNWISGGIAKFNDLLRHDTDNVEKFSINVVKNLVEYLKANQGGLFLMEGEENKEKQLSLVAAYAFDREKYLKKKINIGEGLAGTVVLEKKTIFLKDIPEDYMNITSGMGGARPRSLMIVPLIFNEEVTGVLELASFNEFQPHEIEFVEKIAESTALTLNSVRLNVYTKVLLEESNERAEELAAQEEEMRQNLEELKATQEEMQRIKEKEAAQEAKRREQEKQVLAQMKKKNDELQEKTKALEWEQVMFNTLMDNLSARITFKDTESRYVRINKTKVKALGIKDQTEVLGKTDFDVFGASHSQQALDAEKEMIRSGASVFDKEELVRFKDGRVSWGSTSRIPLKNEEGKIMGGLVITWDINDRKNAQLEIELNDKLMGNVLSNLPVLKYKFDKNGNIQFISGRGLKMLGYKESDLIGKSYFKLYPEIKPILDEDLKEEGYSFSQIIDGREFRHIIFLNKMTTGGFTGIAFEVDASRIL